jgi:hypothetical protein
MPKIANVYDGKAFGHLVERFGEQMIVRADNSFHCGPENGGDPPNLKVCQHKTWSERMTVETMLSMLTRGVPLQEGGPPGLELLHGALGIHGGRVQCVGAVEQVRSRRRWKVPSLHRPVCSVN